MGMTCCAVHFDTEVVLDLVVIWSPQCISSYHINGFKIYKSLLCFFIRVLRVHHCLFHWRYKLTHVLLIIFCSKFPKQILSSLCHHYSLLQPKAGTICKKPLKLKTCIFMSAFNNSVMDLLSDTCGCFGNHKHSLPIICLLFPVAPCWLVLSCCCCLALHVELVLVFVARVLSSFDTMLVC